jgi:hypothetical protein
MAVYVVTWNLNKEKPNYATARQDFIKQLDAYESISDRGLETVRLISSVSSAAQIEEYLRQKLDTNDRLFVSAVRQGGYAGWMDRGIGPWISARL